MSVHCSRCGRQWEKSIINEYDVSTGKNISKEVYKFGCPHCSRFMNYFFLIILIFIVVLIKVLL